MSDIGGVAPVQDVHPERAPQQEHIQADAAQQLDIPEQEPAAARAVGSGYSLGEAGARHIPHYHDLHEDYVPVNRPLLRDLSSYGWLQEGVGAAGMFFFSGAFWLLATILFEHGNELPKYAPWILLCVVCILFGGVLMWVGYYHFKLKQDRIRDIFHSHPSDKHEAIDRRGKMHQEHSQPQKKAGHENSPPPNL